MLIDSEPPIQKYLEKMHSALDDDKQTEALEYALRVKDLMQAPEAVVRCKDCKWYEAGERVCRHPSGFVGDCGDLFFCPDGERKEAHTE